MHLLSLSIYTIKVCITFHVIYILEYSFFYNVCFQYLQKLEHRPLGTCLRSLRLHFFQECPFDFFRILINVGHIPY